jgi:ribonuclease HI
MDSAGHMPVSRLCAWMSLAKSQYRVAVCVCFHQHIWRSNYRWYLLSARELDDEKQAHIRHHCKEATSVLRCSLDNGQTGISLIQEPYVYHSKVKGLGNAGLTHYVKSNDNPVRACVFTHNSVNAILLKQFSSGDFVAVQIRYSRNGIDHKLICCSAYLPYDRPVLTRELVNLTEYCKSNRLNFVIGCDANSHHLMWGSSNINQRGTDLFEFISASDLSILNKGSRPTFVTKNREEVIDITICSIAVELDVSGWHVSKEYSMSDHQSILFSLSADSVAPIPFRNPKKTNWVSFREKLDWRLGNRQFVIGSTKDIENEVNDLTDSIIFSYEESCSLSLPKDRRDSMWKNSDLRKLKAKCNRAWNKRHRDYDAFKESRKAYKKACRQEKRRSWREFCGSVEGCSASARIHRILSKDREEQVCSLKLPNGDYTSDENSLLSHLLETHFPGCANVDVNQIEEEEEKLISSASDSVIQVTNKIVNPQTVSWAIESFSPFKSAGPDGIFPALLQEGLETLVHPLCVIFSSCLILGYVPRKWRDVRVTFIPKPGRADYEQAKNHRGISLSSFLLKTLERVVDRFVRYEILIKSPLHSSQHAYQTGNSTMSAIHKLTSLIESTLDFKEVALAVFLDIEGAFDRATFLSFENAAKRKGVNPFIIDWILAMLKKRILIADLKGVKVRKRPVMGCPQGGVLSPLIWLFIADALLISLEEARIHSVGFADDFVIVVRGSIVDVVFERMQHALRIVEQFTNSVSLSVNPSKVGAMLFTRRRNFELKPLRLFGSDIKLVSEFKFLGLTLDCKLSWKPHLETRIKKACMTFGQCRRAIGRTWGLTPKVIHWLYTSVVRPILSYGAVTWWQTAQQKTVIAKLNHLQRLGLLGMTGAMSTTPTAALECLCGLVPLHIFVEAEARAELFRLKTWGHFRPQVRIGNGHEFLWSRMERGNPLWNAPNDYMASKILTDRRFTAKFPLREDWVEGIQPQYADLTFYTDGSLCEELAGSGVFSVNPELQLVISLGPYISVFQAEVLAIAECARYCLQKDFSAKRISICSDSRAALQALTSWKLDSKLVLECRELLQELAGANTLTLVWVPGHSLIEGNENADELARMGSSKLPVAQIPCIPLSKGWAKSVIKDWSSKTHVSYWRDLDSCEQTKLRIEVPLSSQEAKRIYSLKKADLRKLVGVVSGHFYFNKHLHTMGLKTSTLCERCFEDEDTAYHLICLCPRYANRRFKILGDFVISLEQYRKLSLWKIKSFIADIPIKTQEGVMTGN